MNRAKRLKPSADVFDQSEQLTLNPPLKYFPAAFGLCYLKRFPKKGFSPKIGFSNKINKSMFFWFVWTSRK